MATKKMTVLEVVELGIDLVKLFGQNICEMSLPTRAVAYFLVDGFLKGVKARREEIREKLIGECRQKGRHHTPKTRRLVTEGDTVVDATKRVSASYDEGKIREILTKKGIDPRKVFSTKMVEEFDREAWQSLIKLEVIGDDEARSAVEEKVSWSIKVKPGPGLLGNGKVKELLG